MSERMFLVSYRRRSEHSITILATDEEAAKQQFLAADHYRGCGDCGAEQIADDEVLSVVPA